MAADKTAEIISAMPKLHFWEGEWRTGGFARPQLELLQQAVEETSPGKSARVLETGAGLSTLVFLSMGAQVTSFMTMDDLRERIAKAAEEYGLDAGLWDYKIGFSEFALPRYLDKAGNLSLDVALIDGGHGIHTVFTDFTYCYAALRKGGVLLLDDVQLPSVGVLYGLLKREPGLKAGKSAGKLVSFQKTTDGRLLSDFKGQAFLNDLAKALEVVG